jgi:pimeloyl-ACP methyl ester carboxylesterase
MRRRRFLRGALISLGILILLVLVGPFLVPVPTLEGTQPAASLADPDSQFVEINGLSVHFKSLGQGDPTFVLLHGFGASLYSWHAVMEALAEHGRVFAYDRVAFGLTERPLEWSGQNPYTSQAGIDQLLALLDHFDIQQAILVGNSAGGTLAMNFYLAHPERVQALVLVDPAVYEGGGGPAWLRPLYRTPQMQHLGPLLARQIAVRGPELVELAWYDPARMDADTLEMYRRPLQVENWDRALWLFTTYSQPSGLSDRLDEFDLPILVVTGDSDRIVPTEQSIRLAGELPGARLVVIPQAGHVPHEERPDLFLQAVFEYLASQP